MSERKILEELIQDGKDAEKKLRALDEPIFSIGDRFESGGSCCKIILAYLGDCLVGLVQLDNGHLRGVRVKVVDSAKITPYEFTKVCCGMGLTRYWDFDKQVKI